MKENDSSKSKSEKQHGVFKVTNPIPQFTKAKFLSEMGKETSVFVRFSTVQGSRGSTDMPRDVRGFAVKFYTEDGIYDLVGNNIAPFFINDAIKFPDFVHAVKPEPRNEIPQAASAHDTFWDFVSTSPETFHAVFWLMSDRCIPRSLRMIEGFGTHTFRFINDSDESFFVKFHWKPVMGLQSLVWDENQKISGKDPDFHRRDLWDAIQVGEFPEWDLGVQILPDGTEEMFETMSSDTSFKEFVRDTYLHYKPIAANGKAVGFIKKVIGEDLTTTEGIVEDGPVEEFVDAVKEARFWNR